MKQKSKRVFKGKIGYHLSKLAPHNFKIGINLKNGMKYIVRSRTMDRAVIKEVWLKNIYNQHGIKVEEGDTVVDIGAHIGVFSTYAAELNKTGKIFAFEPFSENYTMLEQHKVLNKKENLTTYNKAVARATGKQTLYLSPNSNTGGHSFHLTKNSDREIEVETTTLRAFCDQNNIGTIDFLKLDCEGAEFEILQADKSILDNVKKIVLECHPYEHNTVMSMMALLKERGFKVYRDSSVSDEQIQMLYGKK